MHKLRILFPCPFCGCTEIKLIAEIDEEGLIGDTGIIAHVYAYCTECEASTSRDAGEYFGPFLNGTVRSIAYKHSSVLKSAYWSIYDWNSRVDNENKES